MIDLQDMRKKGYIIKLQGREYTTHAGLLATAHENGLEGLWVEMVSWDPDARAAVMKATAKGQRGTYTDYGDASPSNVGKMIANACIRMAATRASSRALRLYLGVGMTCFEELPGKDNEPQSQYSPPPKQNFQPDPKQVAAGWNDVKTKGRDAFFYNECLAMDVEPELAEYMVCKAGKVSDISSLSAEKIKSAMQWIDCMEDKEFRKWKADFLGEAS